jgi:hypothetical protein
MVCFIIGSSLRPTVVVSLLLECLACLQKFKTAVGSKVTINHKREECGSSTHNRIRRERESPSHAHTHTHTLVGRQQKRERAQHRLVCFPQQQQQQQQHHQQEPLLSDPIYLHIKSAIKIATQRQVYIDIYI